jgi:hypothetical protein
MGGIGDRNMPKKPMQTPTIVDPNPQVLTVPLPVFEPNAESIAKLAYQLWFERGRPEGSPEVDWFHAESLLRSPKTINASSTVS